MIKRLLLLTVVTCALPLLGTTYQYGKCKVSFDTTWLAVKALWTLNFGDCGAK